MSDYITVDQLRDWIGSETTNFQSAAQAACTVASRAIDTICDRHFFQDAAVSDHYYCPENSWDVCLYDDISTTTGLVVTTDDGYNGFTSGTTTWTITTDFILKPRNPIAGITFPFNELAGTGTRYFPLPQLGREETVKVTAKWGWATTPDAVTHATRMYAAWLFKQKDAPDGFIGLDGWGPRFLRENPTIASLLSPYMRNAVTVV